MLAWPVASVIPRKLDDIARRLSKRGPESRTRGRQAMSDAGRSRVEDRTAPFQVAGCWGPEAAAAFTTIDRPRLDGLRRDRRRVHRVRHRVHRSRRVGFHAFV